MDKVSSLTSADVFKVEDVKKSEEKEMELVDPSEFEGIKAESVTLNDLEQMYALAQEMVKFAHARGGAGLTLPQIGISKRGFVFLSSDNSWEMMINPEYFAKGKKATVYERSLSYEGAYALQRYKAINAAYFTLDVDDKDRLIMKKRYKMMSGLKAFMYQSLVDVLDGKTGRTDGIKLRSESDSGSSES